jgi:hypothetical protein
VTLLFGKNRAAVVLVGWLKKLDVRQPAKQIMEIEEDVLGAYFFRIPQIEFTGS